MKKKYYKKGKRKYKKMQDYKIILMDHEGEIVSEYSSYIVPTSNDTILLEENRSFNVQNRHFSINSFKVVLLGELDKPIEAEEIKK